MMMRSFISGRHNECEFRIVFEWISSCETAETTEDRAQFSTVQYEYSTRTCSLT